MLHIELLRRQRRWSQNVVAKLAGCGLHQPDISLLELGFLKLRADQAAALARIFGVPADELLKPVDAVTAADTHTVAAER